MKRSKTTAAQREKALVASLIDPATRPAAQAACTNRGIVAAMFTDARCRENFELVQRHGPEALSGYIDQEPATDFSTPDTDPIAAEIVADFEKRQPPTPEQILDRAGMKIEDAADFIKRSIPAPRWIVQDFIAQHMKGDLCGGAKSMKTFATLQMAVCIAAGRDFLNVYHIDKPHTVAYLNLELFDWNAQERLAAITNALDIDAEQLRGRLHTLNMRANPAALRGERDLGTCAKCPNRDTCHGKAETICRAETAKRIVDAFSALLLEKGVELVIIDPRYKLIMPGEDENTGDGLRGVLALRDALARHFAVLIVTHDPKGDTAERKTTDRGAGSYTAGADFDFRLTIDRSKDYNDETGELLYVVAAACRARKTPPKIGVRFNGQVFEADETLSTELRTTKNRGQLTESEKIAKNRKEADDFRTAALELANEHGAGDPIATEVFKVALKDRPGGAVGEKKRDEYFNALLAEGAIVKQPELRRDPKTGGTVVKARKNGGRVFVMTPDAANAYRGTFEGLAI